jgi:hypothetical protein
MNFKLTIILCLALLTSSSGVFGQQAPDNPYIFPAFVKSTVLQKGGASVTASLNYNTITQEMLFEKDGKNLVLDPSENIDTLFLQNRKFIISGKSYLEKLTETAVPLYVQYKSEAVRVSKQTDEANKVLSKSYKTGSDGTVDPYSLKLPDSYRIQTDNKYWLQKDAKFVLISNFKRITSLFPGKEDQITQFVKEHKIDINDGNALIKLIAYCNQ